METITSCWPICLEHPPELRFFGWGVFGPVEKRTWKLDFWCFHLYRYRAELVLNGEPFQIEPGHAGLIPPGVDIAYYFKDRSEHIAAHFDLKESRGPLVDIPVLHPLGIEFETFWADSYEAVGWQKLRPKRAEARLWDLLWRLARTEMDSTHGGAKHPVEHAQQIIERRLSQALRVDQIALEVGLSHNHLTRLFRERLGNTVVGYIRECRIQRARHLLAHSNLPIKAVAVEVGIGDLHLFNKIIRKALGSSPRGFREKSSKRKDA